MQRARENGLRVGAYHFFRASQPVAEQLEAIAAHDREHIQQLQAMQSTALLQA